MEISGGDAPAFEFEVAGTGRDLRHGLVVFGWVRSKRGWWDGPISTARLPGRTTRLTGFAMMCGPGAADGGPDARLTLADESFAGGLVAGDRLTGGHR